MNQVPGYSTARFMEIFGSLKLAEFRVEFVGVLTHSVNYFRHERLRYAVQYFIRTTIKENTGVTSYELWSELSSRIESLVKNDPDFSDFKRISFRVKPRNKSSSPVRRKKLNKAKKRF